MHASEFFQKSIDQLLNEFPLENLRGKAAARGDGSDRAPETVPANS